MDVQCSVCGCSVVIVVCFVLVEMLILGIYFVSLHLFSQHGFTDYKLTIKYYETFFYQICTLRASDDAFIVAQCSEQLPTPQQRV